MIPIPLILHTTDHIYHLAYIPLTANATDHIYHEPLKTMTRHSTYRSHRRGLPSSINIMHLFRLFIMFLCSSDDDNILYTVIDIRNRRRMLVKMFVSQCSNVIIIISKCSYLKCLCHQSPRKKIILMLAFVMYPLKRCIH